MQKARKCGPCQGISHTLMFVQVQPSFDLTSALARHYCDHHRCIAVVSVQRRKRTSSFWVAPTCGTIFAWSPICILGATRLSSLRRRAEPSRESVETFSHRVRKANKKNRSFLMPSPAFTLLPTGASWSPLYPDKSAAKPLYGNPRSSTVRFRRLALSPRGMQLRLSSIQ